MKKMSTFFAKAERKTPEQVRKDLVQVLSNPLTSELLYLLSGVVLILNEDRQILTSNQSFLDLIGVDSPQTVLGLRPGEALECIHAHDMPGGCGTGQACASCGAALAIVTSMCQDQPVERLCALSIKKKEKTRDLFLRVRATPFQIDEETKIVLVCMQDITAENRWANLERVFYHDMNNLITALIARIGFLDGAVESEKGRHQVNQLQLVSNRLVQEIAIQQLLTSTRSDLSLFQLQEIHLSEIVAELSAIYHHHPKARNRRLRFPQSPRGKILSDPSLVVRIVGNMITNALEASTREGEEIVLTLLESQDQIGFQVSNPEFIPESVQPRIFQRHFSTKEGFGRGLGTYAMKLLGEQILGGRVEFSSSPSQGTTFTLWIKKEKGKDPVSTTSPSPPR